MIDQDALKEFDEIYYKTYGDILKYVVCHCSNIADVSDIVQEVYIAFYKVLLKQKQIDNIDSYLMGIAKKKVKDYYRFKYKDKVVSLFSKKDDIELIEKIPSDIDINKLIINKENINYIWTYLKHKNVVISKIFYLYYYQDATLKEIAEELDMSESNVKNYLYRTLKELNAIFMKERD